MSARKSNPLAGMASTMTDGMEMMRRMWGMTGLPQIPTASGIAQFAQGLPQALPSMITPTLDVGELDKRIADLRAVEQWLNLNATMLRTTIQTLEVQRNTIATLKSFGGNMLASMNGRGGAGERTAVPMAGSETGEVPNTDWPPQRVRHEMPAPTPEPLQSTASHPAPKALRRRPAAKAETKPAPALPVNAAAWWGALQDQFARVAAAAVTPSQPSASKAAGKSATEKAARARKASSVKAASARRKANSSSG